MSSKSDKLDECTDEALKWALSVLKMVIEPDDPNWLKINQLQAQAAALAGQLSARVDPAKLRGTRGDRVGEALARGLAEAKAKKS